MNRLPGTPAGAAHDVGWAQLTDRERQVVYLLADGRTNMEISGTLFITQGTVRSHIRRIARRLGLSSSRSLIAWSSRLHAESDSRLTETLAPPPVALTSGDRATAVG